MPAFNWLPMSVYTCVRTEMLSIKSPLRYPRGKQRAIAKIANYLPQSFCEFCEPLIGDVSVFFHLCQTYPGIKYSFLVAISE